MGRLTEAGWTPRPRSWNWRAYLTDDERTEVETLERQQCAARQSSAEATAQINPIRNRAIHRAKYAAGRTQLPDPTPGQDDQDGPAPREGGGA